MGPSIRREKRCVSGVVLVDKPLGLTSNATLQQVKRLYQAAKAGHTGTLDPMATGLLPICLGEATKFAQFSLDADKAYLARIRLGETTTTGDAEGETVARLPVEATPSRIEAVLHQFEGAIEQIPPMYSALKHKGQALYTYARAGLDIDRAPRPVFIHALRLEAASNDELEVSVRCSKGTYIRVLAEDIGRALGCGAHLAALRRTASGGWQVEAALTPDSLEAMSLSARDEHLLPPDCLVAHLPRVDLVAPEARRIGHGQSAQETTAAPGVPVRLYAPGGRFLGIGEGGPDGRVVPVRLTVENGGPRW
ncbi:MAG: tRNA pseudouridine(55) synthase TruB [Betaproteobacteria bacterium]|nr:tRNA pseudouridine(55) synthase TruB [Betaproteobacteria bacterium]